MPLPPVHEFLNINVHHLCIMALKQAEFNPESWVLRVYESAGKVAELGFKNNLNLAISENVDLLERTTDSVTEIHPWKIASFHLIIKKGDRPGL